MAYFDVSVRDVVDAMPNIAKAYAAGLAAEGPPVDPEMVRFAVLVHLVFGLGILDTATALRMRRDSAYRESLEVLLGRPIEKVLDRRGEMAGQLVAWGEEILEMEASMIRQTGH